MSHRAPPDKRGFYITLPNDLQLPLYDRSQGYCVRDESISAHVQRALLDEYAGMSLAKPVARDRGWPRLTGALQALRRVFGSLLAYAGAFSLGMLAGRC